MNRAGKKISGLFVSSFVVPKAGVTRAECEDALCVLPEAKYDALRDGVVTAAVCDGATESLLSGSWAKLLAGHAAESASLPDGLLASPARFEAFAAGVVEGWAEWLKEYTDGRATDGRPLQWYEEAKLGAGAHATLLVASLAPDPDPDVARWSWRAAALGDSCLFQVRDGTVLAAHPVADSDAFGYAPDLFGSTNRDTALLANRTGFFDGTCVSGDVLLLATDALAAWFLSQPRPGEAADVLTEYARNPGDEGPFAAWVQDQRDRGAMRNDDVALVHIDAQGQ